MESFASMPSGGHPNSIGRTDDVVDIVLADKSRLAELYGCYQHEDEVVQLRTSSAMKRLEAVRHNWITPYTDRLIDEVGEMEQPSAQWTLAQLFLKMGPDMSPSQRSRATDLLKCNLSKCDDWIVLINTMETLSDWSQQHERLATWLLPHLRRLSKDNRKSVAKRAIKLEPSVIMATRVATERESTAPGL